MEITVKNVTVHKYFTPTTVGGKTYPGWTIAWDSEEGRKRKKFSTEAAADKFGNDKAEALNKGFTKNLTAEQVASYNRAHDLLLPTGRAMELVAAEYADSWRITGGVGLRQLAEFWQRHHSGNSTITVKQALDELLARRKKEGRTERHTQDLKSRLEAFAHDFQMPVVTLTATMIDDWLHKLNVKPRTRENYRQAVRNLMNYCKDRRYLSKEWDEMPNGAVRMAHDTHIEIYTPDEMKKLIIAAQTANTPTSKEDAITYPILPLIVLGGFAGIRTEEIQRLDWKDVHEDVIDVQGKRTRSMATRYVDILPTAAAWLAICREKRGPVCRYQTLHNVTGRLARMAGISWKHNGLRHSFISYRLPLAPSVDDLAAQCGNSASMIFRNYRERVKKTEAPAWWDLTPENCKPASTDESKPAPSA